MSGNVFRRLSWKEYRLQRSFWFALFIAGLLFQVGVLVTAWGEECGESLLLVSATVTAFYALGCAATAYAGEKENETYDYQRSLPVAAIQVFWSKVFFAVGSTALLGIGLAGSTWLITLTDFAEWRLDSALAVSWPVRCTELLAWGWLFSLLSSRPLRAAALAGLAAAICSNLLQEITGMTASFGVEGGWPLLRVFFDAIPVWATLIAVAIVLLVDYRLARRWFDEPSLDESEGVGAADDEPSGILWGLDDFSVWYRLMWQHTRLVRPSLFMATAIALVGLILFGWMSQSEKFVTGLTAVLLVLLSGLVGVYCFHGDQVKDGFRFFAERGVSPKRVWRARFVASTMLWLVVTLVMVMILAILDAGVVQKIGATFGVGSFRDFVSVHSEGIYRNGWNSPQLWNTVATTVGLSFIAFSVGQLCSMWSRSAILAAAFTTFVSLLMFGWTGLMFGAGINLVWAVAPVPFVLWFASWYTAEDWILERRNGRSRLRKFVLLAVPASLIAVAVIHTRWTEIPDDVPEFAVVQPSPAKIAAAEETRAKYVQIQKVLLDRLRREVSSVTPESQEEQERATYVDPFEFLGEPLSDRDAKWVENNAELLTLIRETARRGNLVLPTDQISSVYPLFDIGDPWSDYRQGVHSARVLLVRAARFAESKGQFDDAINDYLSALDVVRHHQQYGLFWYGRLPPGGGYDGPGEILGRIRYWAGLPGQNPTLVRKAISELQLRYQRIPTAETAFQTTLRRSDALLDGNCSRSDAGFYMSDRDWKFVQLLLHALPWERERMRRLCRARACLLDRKYGRMERCLKTGRRWPEIVDQSSSEVGWGRTLERWEETTPFRLGIPGGDPEFSSRINIYTEWRATEIVLALEAWKLECGQWPESLSDLVPEYLVKLPLDPVTARPFVFYPAGSATELQWSNKQLTFDYALRVPPGRPYLEIRRAVADNARRLFPPVCIYPLSARK